MTSVGADQPHPIEPIPGSGPAPEPDDAPVRVVRGRFRRDAGWKLLVLFTAGLISFLAVSQLRGPDRFREQLSAETEGDLARILASLSTESNALQEELASLKVQLATLQSSSAEQGNASAEAANQLDSLRVLAGTVPVTGPGLRMEVADPNGQVTYDVLVDAVQELRDAGAEAITINGRRLGVSSSFGVRDGKVTLDDVPLPVPYTIDAIGPAATMEGGIKIPGGALDTLRALKGVSVDHHRVNAMDMPALADAPTFRTARPVPAD
jgi:uncharacterized protein YlxW (UPF0749 family)